MGRGMLLLRDAVLGATDTRYEGARDFAEVSITSVEKDSTGGTISGRGTIGGAGEDSVPMRGVTNTQVGDLILVSYPKGNPSGMKKYEYHIRSANPAPQIIVDATLPDPVFAIVPYTSDIIASAGSILANMVVFFLAVEERFFPEGYTASFRVAGGEWRESGFAPHIGGAQQILLGSDFTPGTSIQVRLRAHYARSAVMSPGLDTRTFIVATDNISPGIATGMITQTNIPKSLKFLPQGVLDAAHFDHWRYFVATSSGGAGLETLDGPTGYVYAGIAGPRYVAVAPVSKSGVVGTRYPAVAGTYDGPYTILDFAPPLDTTPPPTWAAPTLSQTTNNSANGGEEHWVTVTLPGGYAYPADYAYTLVTMSGTGFSLQDRIDNGTTSTVELVQPVGTISVTLIGVDKLGNKGTASPAATISVTPTGVPATMGNVNTQSASLAIVVRWTTIVNSLGYKVFRASDAAGTGAVQIGGASGTIDGHLLVDQFNGASVAGQVWYYKVQAFNLKGDGGVSPAWIPGTVGAYDGSNIVAQSVTASKLEANMIIGSIIRTPMTASGYIGMFGNAGNSSLIGYDASSVLNFILYGGGLIFYRDGANPRAAFNTVGSYFYNDANAIRAQFTESGLAVFANAGGTAITISHNPTYGNLALSIPAGATFASAATVNSFDLASTRVLSLSTAAGANTLATWTAGGLIMFGAGISFGVGNTTAQTYMTLANGAVSWGNGGGYDTNLYRVSAGILKSDHILYGASGVYVKNPVGLATQFPYQHRAGSAMPSGANSSGNAFSRWEAFPASTGNTMGLELITARGPSGAPSGDWQDARWRLQTSVDTNYSVGGYLELGSRDYNPFWGFGTVGTGITLFWDAVNGRVSVPGAMFKGSGSFKIPHPDPAKTDTHDLLHSFVESPTAGDNLYRFRVEVIREKVGQRQRFALPDYFPWLNEDAQCWVSPVKHFGQGWAEVLSDGSSYVLAADSPGWYNIIIVATRKDKIARDSWAQAGGVEPLRKRESA